MKRRVTRAERARIVDLYERGWSAMAVAGEFNVSKSTVLRVVADADVEVRPRGRRYT